VAGISIIPMWARLAGIAVVLSGTFGVGYHKGSVSRDGDVAKALAQAVQSQADQAATERARQKDAKAWIEWRDKCAESVADVVATSKLQAETFRSLHAQESAAQKRLRAQLADLEAHPITGMTCEDAVNEAVARAVVVVGSER